MCEIFCFSAKSPKQTNHLLEEFFSHSDEHPHGWGLVKIVGKDSYIKKEPLKASDSDFLKDLLAVPITAQTVLAHIRLATVGNINLFNCHPFIMKDNSGRSWILMHNGTLFEFSEGEKYKKIQKGSTDSERILLHIIDSVNEFEAENGSLSLKERFKLINDLLCELAEGNKLNIMIYDGELTYIHSNMKECLYCLDNGSELIFSSSPVSGDENWREIEINTVFGINDGEILFKGKNHGREFVFTEEHEKAIMEMMPWDLEQ